MKKIKFTRENIALLFILVLSSILNLTNLSIEGYGNQYYAAGVKSMTMSLKNFFFVSYDPASFVTIDKPPLGFWIQAISAKIFGYHGWSIILPQAIAGVISVALIYIIVKRSFGTMAGLISALCLAVTPVFVAVSRNNTCDNLLVMALLFASLALSVAAEKGKIKYLILSLVVVGLGFNIKMLQAYMIAPALYITYLLSNAVSIKKRIMHLALGTAVLLVVSFSWAFIVDLVPSSSRPYVGSSTNNSEMQLIVGHNGLERLGVGGSSTQGGGKQGMPTGGPQGDGQREGFPGGAPSGDGQNQGFPGGAPNADGQRPGFPGGKPGDGQGRDGQGQGKMGQGGGTFGGQEKSSFTRLFSNNSLSDQIIWFFPLAIIGFIAAALKEKLNYPFDNKRKLDLILWSMWLLPEFIYFSYTTGLFHPYYLTMMAPPIAALAGIGITAMWQFFKEGGKKAWFLPAALVLNGAVQVLILSYNSTSNIAKITMAASAVLCFGASILLAASNLLKNKEISLVKNEKLKKGLVAAALTGLLIAPTVWSGTTMFYTMSGTFPAAGLSLVSSGGKGAQGMGRGMSNNSSSSKLIEFLQKNKTTEKYILVTSSTNGYASDIIIKTGESVMTSGFFGTDKAITLAQFKELVKKGEVRYVMVGGQGGGNDEIMTWAKTNGKLVSESEWKDSTTAKDKAMIENNNDGKNDKTSENSNSTNQQNQMDGRMGGGMSEQLYDLKGADTTK